ncbi:MAG TPA: hypothetical protein DD426_09330 [Clostridiaceae bacterium]|nr:hypothetical protein [Clostridiaceae bacterium]
MLMASLIINNIKIAYYLPLLIIAGIGTGIFVGLTSMYLLKYIKKIHFDKII